MTQDVEMKEQAAAAPALSDSVSSAAPSTLQQLKDIASLIETGSYAREVRRIVRAIRLTISLRKKLKASVVYAFLNFALAPGSEVHSRLSSFLPQEDDQDTEVDTAISATQAPVKHYLPELEIYCYLLVVIFLIDQKRYNEAKACSSASITCLKNLNRRTVDVLAARLYFYYSLSYELTGDLSEIRGLGIRSLVLESSEGLRVTGFAFTTWTNAWKALDQIGIGDSLRQQHQQLYRLVAASTISGLPAAEMSFEAKASHGNHEVRCMRRRLLLEALQKELPSDTIRFSSKVVSIEEDDDSGGCFKLVHLANGSVVKAKALIGCDGVNSVVSKWLGLKKPVFAGRSAIRGFADFKDSHGFEPKFLQFMGKGIRAGFIPCNEHTMYWFFTFTPFKGKEKEVEEDPAKMKEFVLSNLGKAPDKVKEVVEITELDSFTCAPLRYRHPWELLWGKISKGNVCVAGDALHPMTPDIGQGGCAALEDGIVLARCLAESLREKPTKEGDEKGEFKRIEMGMKKFAKERRWRGCSLISTAYIVGFVQQGDGVVRSFLRDKILAAFLAGLLLKRADFDCGKLSTS